MKILRKILFYLNILLVAITLLAYLSPYVDPGKIWGLSFFGLFLPFLLLANFLFVFYWLISAWKKSILSITCLILGAHYISLTVSFNDQKNENPGLSIASYNMRYAFGTYKTGTYTYDKKKTTDFSAFIKKDLNADILCAQETNPRINDLLKSHYPYRHFNKYLGTSIFSKFPIDDVGDINFRKISGYTTKRISNSCVWADIINGQDTFRVYSVHLQSNNISRDADQFIKDAEDEQSVDVSKIRVMLSKYKKYVSVRSKQVKAVKKHMEVSPYPIILGGDLNDTPGSYSHRVLSNKMQDAFTVAGSGIGTTYGGNIPFLRIDNLFFSDEFLVHQHKTIRKDFSDHYPIISRVSVK